LGERVKTKFIYYLLLPVVLYGFTTCVIPREDLLKLASTLAVPEIEVLGLPDNYGNYDFGPVEVYTSDRATFTITNTGTGKLRINAISFVEEDETWFTIDTSSLVSIIAPGGSTNFTIKFKPTFSEYRSVSVIILSDDEDENPYTFTVEGSGFGTPSVIPDINVKQGTVDIPDGFSSPIDFGSVEVGASGSKLFTIENNDMGELSVFDVSMIPDVGTEAGEFSVIAPSIPAVLSESEKTDFTILFNPKSTGVKSATVTIQNDDPDENPYTFYVQGNGSAVPYPDINVKQGLTDLPDGSGIYDFGYVQSWTSSSPVSFTIENSGTATLDIYSVTITFGDPSQFVIDTSPPMEFSILSGSSTTFLITFAPDLIEEYKSATVTVDNNDPDESMYTFLVEGWGVATPVPDINVDEVMYDSIFDFGPVLFGSSKTEIFTIVNTGTADLNITDIINKDPDKFSLDYSTVVSPIPPGGGSTYFTITFTPIEDQKRTATIEIRSDDPDEDVFKFKVTAYGSKGPEPDIDVKQGNTSYPHGSEYYFPDTVVGSSSAPVAFSIRNNGTTELVIVSLLLAGKHVEDFDFDYDSELLTVPPGGSFIVTVWFKPNKAKNRDATLKIKSNDPNEEKYEIKLKGKGI
jgi:hypothetical protein